MNAANDDDRLISGARLAGAKMALILDCVRILKSGCTVEILRRERESGAINIFGHHLRKLLADYHRHALKTRKEFEAAQSFEGLTDAQRQAVNEFMQIMEQIEVECGTTEPLIPPEAHRRREALNNPRT
jgi:hypothetical protein